MPKIRSVVNRALAPFGLKLIPRHHDALIYQHDYGASGFDKYREVQIATNKRKFDRVWAEERTLSAIADDIRSHTLGRNGLCHGARNGWEVEWLAKELDCPVLGTDISDTANEVPHLVQHDFHDARDDWFGNFSFIYTNSLDQAFDPAKALNVWTDQLAPDGRIYLEHTMRHSPSGAGEKDPFGAHPMVMPYVLFEWGKGQFRLADILHVDRIDHKEKDRAWVFVLERADRNS